MYQTCTEFGFYQTSDSDKQPFGKLFPLKYVLNWYLFDLHKHWLQGCSPSILFCICWLGYATNSKK